MGNLNRYHTDILELVRACLVKLYRDDALLFDQNGGRGIAERCLVFRFAHYLQNKLGTGYYVDCDYNASFRIFTDPVTGERVVERIPGKAIEEEGQGNIPQDEKIKVDRYIDIIVHEREANQINNHFCFEFKKWGNYSDRKKDRNNVKVLTSEPFCYHLGFFIILGKRKTNTKWEVYEGSECIINGFVFPSN